MWQSTKKEAGTQAKMLPFCQTLQHMERMEWMDFINSSNDELQIDNEVREIIRSIGVGNSMNQMVSALRSRNGGRRKDYGLRGKQTYRRTEEQKTTEE